MISAQFTLAFGSDSWAVAAAPFAGIAISGGLAAIVFWRVLRDDIRKNEIERQGR